MAPQEETSSSSIVVVFVPFPLQSHLSQFLQLSRAIASANVPVHFATSSLHISQVNSRETSRNPNPNITFHGFPAPAFPSPPPGRSMSHLVPSFEAYDASLREPVASLLESLSLKTRRLVVIHDPLTCAIVQDAFSLPNAEFYLFNCVSVVCSFAFARDTAGRNVRAEIPSLEDTAVHEFILFLDRQFECQKTAKISGHIRNTSRVIEGEFLDFVLENERRLYNPDTEQWAVGPMEDAAAFKRRSGHGRRVTQCLEWLNRQEPNSVLYICFGTATFVEDGQIRELAIGLEKSGTKFIWVLLEADKANIFDEDEERKTQLPLGFEERVEASGTGMVVREWVPQMEILGHPSTGGFMSHCGWNSCLESMTLGVPLLTWPMHSDQPMNAALVVLVLKAGLVARDWAKREALASSSTIAEAVARLMKSEEGDEIRTRTEQLGSELRKSARKGGVSRLELESFVAHITRI